MPTAGRLQRKHNPHCSAPGGVVAKVGKRPVPLLCANAERIVAILRVTPQPFPSQPRAIEPDHFAIGSFIVPVWQS